MNLSENEPVLKVTEKDLLDGDPSVTKEPLRGKPLQLTKEDLPDEVFPEPEVVPLKIKYRDVHGGNPLRYLEGVARDVLEALKKEGLLHQIPEWWGEGQSAEQRKFAFEEIELALKDLEALKKKIVIYPEEQLGKPADSHEVQPPADEAQPTADKTEPLVYEKVSPDDEISAGPTWEKYLEQRKAIYDLQLEKVVAMYEGMNLQSPIIMENHLSQWHVGPNTWSCFAASALNALYALREVRPDDDEDKVINEMGGQAAFVENGYIPVSTAQEFLKKRGMVVTGSGNMVQLMQTLENGGVALIANDNGHARMISGLEVKNGNVSLRIHDPLRNTKPEMISVEDFIEGVNQNSSFNMILVQNIPS